MMEERANIVATCLRSARFVGGMRVFCETESFKIQLLTVGVNFALA